MRFSFLMSIPAVLGANILSIVDAVREGFDVSLLPVYLLGMLTAIASGIAAILLMRFISRKSKIRILYLLLLGGRHRDAGALAQLLRKAG